MVARLAPRPSMHKPIPPQTRIYNPDQKLSSISSFFTATFTKPSRSTAPITLNAHDPTVQFLGHNEPGSNARFLRTDNIIGLICGVVDPGVWLKNMRKPCVPRPTLGLIPSYLIIGASSIHQPEGLVTGSFSIGSISTPLSRLPGTSSISGRQRIYDLIMLAAVTLSHFVDQARYSAFLSQAMIFGFVISGIYMSTYPRPTRAHSQNKLYRLYDDFSSVRPTSHTHISALSTVHSPRRSFFALQSLPLFKPPTGLLRDYSISSPYTKRARLPFEKKNFVKTVLSIMASLLILSAPRQIVPSAFHTNVNPSLAHRSFGLRELMSVLVYPSVIERVVEVTLFDSFLICVN